MKAFTGSRSTIALSFALFAAIFSSGCVTAIRPESLRTPSPITCTTLGKPVSTLHGDGLWKAQLITRLERGPYWSERADEHGTFYRAPKGGVSNTFVKLPTHPPQTFDGGFYVPNDPAKPPTVYWYFSMGSIAPEIPAEGADCSNLTTFAEGSGIKVDVAAYATGGALGGAAGGAIARSTVNNSNLSYGQAAGAGAVGGAIGGAIAGAMINAEVGKIRFMTDIEDSSFTSQLRALAEAQVPLKSGPDQGRTDAPAQPPPSEAEPSR